MSSISFPNPSVDPSLPESSRHEGSLYPLSFDGVSNGGFQMNPLSAHPPRTPRTSLVPSSATVYNSEVYMGQAEAEERPTDLEEEIGVDDDPVKSQARSKVRLQEIWHDIVKTSYGRDKAKCLLLFGWLGPLTSILAEHSAPIFPSDTLPEPKTHSAKPLLHTFLHAPPPVLLELVHACADDIATWSLLGLFGKRLGERAGRFADWCWFTGTLVDLVENSVERSIIVNSQRAVEGRAFAESMSGATAKSTPRNSKVDETELQRLQRQDFWLRVQRLKLVMDLVFVSYSVFNIRRAKETVKATTGLTSAILRYCGLLASSAPTPYEHPHPALRGYSIVIGTSS
ncbi:hypothetical protein EVG20_g523 [Dentipellis fragilis]|uniref:Uncharacterized protein n=1 Tax=Dentipellis fragilis TaxID=205917 RepID=A0A4Y9ZET7_9AGAM|nr:hypothetical protein EVG20_g523 [Dentipellis fragilis]